MDCLTEVISKRQGFELVDDGKRKFDDVYFVITRESLAKRIKNMGKKACVSRIPGMYASCTNTRFAACMHMSLRLLPHAVKGIAPFWPETFIIPDDLKIAEKTMNAEVAAWKAGEDKRTPCPAWIVKPSMRAGAEGMPLEQIFLVTTFEALKAKISMMHLGNTEWIMQKYVQDPLLVDGLKFDLRVYAVVLSLDPLKLFICKEGLCRFCTETFAPLDHKGKRSEDIAAHISSYHVNKDSHKFVPPGGNAFNPDNLSSKRPLSVVFGQLKKRGLRDQEGHEVKVDEPKFWTKIEEAVSVGTASMLPVLRSAYCRSFDMDYETMRSRPCQAWQIIGFDFVLRDNLEPVMIQASNQPALGFMHAIPTRAHMHNAGTKEKKKGKALRGRAAKMAAKEALEDSRTGLAVGECHCNDLAAPHTHEKSALDRAVKSMILGGAIELVPVVRESLGLEDGTAMRLENAKKSDVAGTSAYTQVAHEHFAPLERCLRLVERMYVKCGGMKRAFNPNVLKRELGKFEGLFHKKFTKPDLTILCAPFKDVMGKVSVKESASEAGMQEDMSVLKFGDLVMQITAKSYRSEEHMLTRIIAMLSGALEDAVDSELTPSKTEIDLFEGVGAATKSAASADDEVSQIGEGSDDEDGEDEDEKSRLGTALGGAGALGAGGGGGLGLGGGMKPPKSAKPSRDAKTPIGRRSSKVEPGDEDHDAKRTKKQQIHDETLAQVFASDAEQEARIAKLEKRCGTLSELISVLLPHAKLRFAKEDAAVIVEVEAQKADEFQDVLEKQEAAKRREKKARQALQQPKSWNPKSKKGRVRQNSEGEGDSKSSDVPTLPSINMSIKSSRGKKGR